MATAHAVAGGEEADELEPLYADRIKVYPQRVGGRFRRMKWAILIALLAGYYLAPWLRWGRGPGAPDQAFLIDLPGRRAYFLWIEIWPQEVYYLVGLLVIGAIGLFLVTSMLGRVWCGFACPQTLWTDLFMWVERLIEGDRNKRMRLDRAPLSVGKATKKVAKHGVWLAIAFATGGAWIMYFNDAPTVLARILTGEASLKVYGFVGLFTATTYALAGWAREQFCIYMCPWPRFQAAMFDEHTLLVTYEAFRGEPRGHAKPGQSPEGRGHCIDCGLCVRVCPTGIDIRNGQQLDCIGCGLCIDACNDVMAKMGWPKELIAYDSLGSQGARAKGERWQARLVRARTAIYAGLLVAITATMLFLLGARSHLEVTVQPDRAPLFVELSDGRIQNAYTLKILNKERARRSFSLALEGLDGAELSVIGYDPGDDGFALPVGGDGVGTFRFLVRANADSARRSSIPLRIVVEDPVSGEMDGYETIFAGPAS